jgi:hypothetical protein
MNKAIRTSAFIAGAAGLALTTGTLSTGALANAPDRFDPTFLGELTGLNESVGVDTIFSDVAPETVGALNIDTGDVGQGHAGKATKQGKRNRRSVNTEGTA